MLFYRLYGLLSLITITGIHALAKLIIDYFVRDGTNVIRFVPLEVVYFSKWVE